MTVERDSPLRLGILTPVVTMLPTGHAAWEREGTIQDVARIAAAADAIAGDINPAGTAVLASVLLLVSS